jgi:hypothetical protein
MTPRDPAVDDWIARAREVPLDQAATLAGAKLRKGTEKVGPCPMCGGTDRFSVNLSKGVWNCRGAEGGNDSIGLVTHATGRSFLQCVELLTGEPKPGGDGFTDPEVWRERAKERRVEASAADRKRAAEEQRKKDWRLMKINEVLGQCRPIKGTQAFRYLQARGIFLLPEQSEDLLFHPGLLYRGYADEYASEETDLGTFPCMIGVIRIVTNDTDDEIIGLHRTYLDPTRTKKLVPPGDTKRNKAKKVFGSWLGGLIRFGPITEHIALGEGIETTLSWGGLPQAPADVSLAAVVALGNFREPILRDENSAPVPMRNADGKIICDASPDMMKAGIGLPFFVKRVTHLQDGDSDARATGTAILVSAMRQRNLGREAFINRAPEGKDWNDVAMEMLSQAKERVSA